jgi:hypothetical protein
LVVSLLPYPIGQSKTITATRIATLDKKPTSPYSTILCRLPSPNRRMIAAENAAEPVTTGLHHIC